MHPWALLETGNLAPEVGLLCKPAGSALQTAVSLKKELVCSREGWEGIPYNPGREA